MRPLFKVASWLDPRRLFAAKPIRRGSARSRVRGLPTAGVVSEGLEDRKYLSATIAVVPVAPINTTDEAGEPGPGEEADNPADGDPIEQQEVGIPEVVNPVPPQVVSISDEKEPIDLNQVFTNATQFSLGEDAPEFVLINDNGELEFNPESGDQGTFTFTVWASNEIGERVETEITVHVLNHVVTLNSAVPNQQRRAGDPPTNTTMPLDVEDPDGDVISTEWYSTTFKNSRANDGSLKIDVIPTVDETSGEIAGWNLRISGKATTAQVGTHTINLIFNDGHGGDVGMSFKLTITNPIVEFSSISNRIPTINKETTQIKDELTKAGETADRLKSKSTELGTTGDKAAKEAVDLARKLNETRTKQAANASEAMGLAKDQPIARTFLNQANASEVDAKTKYKSAKDASDSATKQAGKDLDAAEAAKKRWKDTPDKQKVVKDERQKEYQQLQGVADKSAALAKLRKADLATAATVADGATKSRVEAEKRLKSIESRIEANRKEGRDIAAVEATLAKDVQRVNKQVESLKAELAALNEKLTASLTASQTLLNRLEKLSSEMVEMKSKLQSLESNSLLNPATVRRLRETDLNDAASRISPRIEQAQKALLTATASQVATARTRDVVSNAQKLMNDASKPVLIR